MRAFIMKDRYVEGCWAGYNSTLERSILKKRAYLEEPAPPPQAREAVAAVAPQPAPRVPSHPASIFAEKLSGALRKDG